jgi:hypothetical protein
VADYEIPEPEPKEIDEKPAIELRHLAENAVLKGQPQGEEQCENCRYYFENTADISYCWHPKVRILVGANLVVPVVGGDPRGLIAQRRSAVRTRDNRRLRSVLVVTRIRSKSASRRTSP